MENEGEELVHAVEFHTDVLHDDGRHEVPHAEDIVSLVPAKIVREETGLEDTAEVDEEAEVKHQEMGPDPLAYIPAQKMNTLHKCLVIVTHSATALPNV